MMPRLENAIRPFQASRSDSFKPVAATLSNQSQEPFQTRSGTVLVPQLRGFLFEWHFLSSGAGTQHPTKSGRRFRRLPAPDLVRSPAPEALQPPLPLILRSH